MEITPDQVIPCLVPANRFHTFDQLHPGWCYEKTRFRVVQLRELYHLLEFLALLTLSDQGHYASLEEAFILTLVKVATGDTNVKLADCFIAYSGDGLVSLIYHFMIDLLDNKARSILYGNADCLWRWVHLFPDFAEIIKNKLNMPQYGGLVFQSCHLTGFLDCKLDETCTLGSGPMTDEELV
jgi:hypothetical protein